MKNIWKIVIFISVLITIVLIRECTLIPDYSPELLPCIRNISKRSVIDWDVLNTTDASTTGSKLFADMRGTATISDILLMTKSLQPVMRVYAACMAKDNDGIDHYEILHAHLNDEAEVEVKSAECAYRRKVGDFYMSFLYCKLSPADQSRIDSIVLYDKTNRLDSRFDVMARVSPDARYYDRIRELYCSEFQKKALVFLARFQKEEDLIYIRKELSRFYNPDMNNALAAVAEFPSPEFLPALLDIYVLFIEEKLHKNIDPQLLFKAMMKYESIKVYAMLKNTIWNADSRFIMKYEKDLRYALSEVNSSFYIPLNRVVLNRKAMLGL